jgi:site-specific DNA recombinase
MIVGYIRTSTTLQQNSIDTQIDTIEKYCDYKGIRSERYFTDFGISGKTCDRPQFNDLIDLIQNNEIDKVIITELSRLGRNLLETLEVVEIFKKHNVDLVVLKENISLKSPSGRMFLNILLTLSQFEREQCSNRVKSVLQHKKENNQVYGTIPYGKRLENGQLVDHEREIFMLKKIKTLKNRGKSYGQITMFLKRNNYLKKNGSQFDRDSLKKLVKNNPILSL